MVGRNRDDKPGEWQTVYLVGSDRISTELDAVTRAANASLAQPMTLDYEFNDPNDPEQLYFRSDHYSYAAKGIPVIFFTTGLHPDYHANTDEVSKIEFDKMARVTGFDLRRPAGASRTSTTLRCATTRGARVTGTMAIGACRTYECTTVVTGLSSSSS